MFSIFRMTLFTLCLLSTVAACGGGSGGSSPSTSPTPEPPAPVVPPSPEPPENLRIYAVGDRLEFSGTRSVSEGSGDPDEHAITAVVEFGVPTYTSGDKPVLAVDIVLDGVSDDFQEVYTVHIWQEPDGSAYDLTDEYGKYYRDSATNEDGIQAVPVPLIGFAEEYLQFYTMYGGNTSGPITMGERKIVVGSLDTVTVPAGTFEAQAVSRVDEYEYLTSFDDHKRDESVVEELIMWVSQEQGVIKIDRTYQQFSPNGLLQNTTRLMLEATSTGL